jgi:hypothetical protein
MCTCKHKVLLIRCHTTTVSRMTEILNLFNEKAYKHTWFSPYLYKGYHLLKNVQEFSRYPYLNFNFKSLVQPVSFKVNSPLKIQLPRAASSRVCAGVRTCAHTNCSSNAQENYRRPWQFMPFRLRLLGCDAM